MPWYKVLHKNGKVDHRHSTSENTLLFHYVQNGYWQFTIVDWRPRKMDYKALHTFYTEVQSALQSGLQLNQTVAHLAQSSTHSNIATLCKAMLGELENGTAFNDILIKLSTPSAAPYCQLLNAHGTRESAEKSLEIAILQLDALLNWSQRLLKAIAYPFSIIQIALIISLTNKLFQSKSTDLDFWDNIISLSAIYLLCSSIQLIIIHSLYRGYACHWLEKYSHNFRLTKLFSLLNTTRKSGLTLQHALKNMPEYFRHDPIKHEIYTVYYTLRLGRSYAKSFPPRWFPHESAIALHSAEQDGDISRALSLAAQAHEKRWQKNLSLLEKLLPACCLFIAGGFVASALVSLYAPLLDIS
ncbi:secretion system protein [Marinomonas sp. M1K-6]|uniref:Secretion system protein n=1 Tax=Marinomonas profundi TaxID=2726122 RepID=A0A847R9V4_9GAMM|nr:type II secretion system F family protein [Marinomonas profundi]NLQ18826.1 secretion system protein [Marinomonas profundi]UDV02968.1 type II secretion system F family protein [Marinomonas profundi]